MTLEANKINNIQSDFLVKLIVLSKIIFKILNGSKSNTCHGILSHYRSNELSITYFIYVTMKVLR